MVNLDDISYLKDSHGKKAVVLSMESYEKIREQLEELEDIKSYIEHKNSGERTLPFDLVQELISTKASKVKIIRKYREMTVVRLSKATGITESYLSQIENNKRTGTVEIYKKLAKALDIDIEIII